MADLAWQTQADGSSVLELDGWCRATVRRARSPGGSTWWCWSLSGALTDFAPPVVKSGLVDQGAYPIREAAEAMAQALVLSLLVRAVQSFVTIATQLRDFADSLRTLHHHTQAPEGH